MPRIRRQRTWRGSPRDYHVVCISLYPEDVDRADRLINLAKSGGDRRANRSAVIRKALEHFEKTATNPQPEENL